MAFTYALFYTVVYFFIFLALLSVLFKTAFHLPTEMVRKFQHIGYALSIFLFLHLYDPWYQALYAIGGFMVFIFFGLWVFEKSVFYKQYLVDRNKHGGELKYSMLQALGMFALLLILFLGLLPGGTETIIVTAVMSWGVGDALAALLGKRFGKRKNRLIGADPTKTQVGSHAMSHSVFLVVVLFLIFYGDILWWVALVCGVFVAPLATLIEAYAKKGLDTIILPTSIALLLYGVLSFFAAIGVL